MTNPNNPTPDAEQIRTVVAAALQQRKRDHPHLATLLAQTQAWLATAPATELENYWRKYGATDDPMATAMDAYRQGNPPRPDRPARPDTAAELEARGGPAQPAGEEPGEVAPADALQAAAQRANTLAGQRDRLHDALRTIRAETDAALADAFGTAGAGGAVRHPDPVYDAVYRVIHQYPPRSSDSYSQAIENGRVWRAVEAALAAERERPREPATSEPAPVAQPACLSHDQFQAYLHDIANGARSRGTWEGSISYSVKPYGVDVHATYSIGTYSDTTQDGVTDD